MATAAAVRVPEGTHVRSVNWTDPVFQAFALLRVGFTVAPILFGLDKFLNWLVDWEIYLAPELDDLIPGNAHDAMLAVGVIEIAAGLVVAVRPRIGGYLVAALAGRDHREPPAAGRLLRHRVARLRPPAGRADPGPPGDGIPI